MTKTFQISDITKTGIGDVELSNFGQPLMIEAQTKLSQDILEILLVIQGERDVPRTMPSFGSNIFKIIGYPLPQGSLETLLKSAIDSAVRKLKDLQSKKRSLEEAERIVKVSALEVKSTSDPLGYTFYLLVDTAAKTTIKLEGVLY